ncbi:MAG TPA: DUF1559 domain-containing protein [Pirellulales bacterium]|nr:DUF1559 domain-containing protein [Pirellulales bacterium]
MRRSGIRSAVALMEVLVAISIVGLLVALCLPAISASRESARRAQCQNSIRQLGVAVSVFHSANARFPRGVFGGPYGIGKNSIAWSWTAQILPLLERRDLYEGGHIQQETLAQSVATAQQISLLLCPSSGAIRAGPRTDAGNLFGLAVGQSTYKAVSGANWGTDSTWPPGSAAPTPIPTEWPHIGTNGSYDGLSEGDGAMYRSDYKVHRGIDDISDGTSNTLLIGEDVPSANSSVSWPYANNAYGTCAIPPNLMRYDPADWPNTWSFRSRHPGGLNFAIADGSARWLSDSIELPVYRALATIRGHEILGDDQWR